MEVDKLVGGVDRLWQLEPRRIRHSEIDRNTQFLGYIGVGFLVGAELGGAEGLDNQGREQPEDGRGKSHCHYHALPKPLTHSCLPFVIGLRNPSLRSLTELHQKHGQIAGWELNCPVSAFAGLRADAHAQVGCRLFLFSKSRSVPSATSWVVTDHLGGGCFLSLAIKPMPDPR